MRNVKRLLAVGVIAATTAACVGDTGYYGSSYGYPGTSYNSGYYAPSNSAYYSRVPRRGPNGDYDRDGIPNKYDRDANGDGVPDRYQR
jgi:hypothetical protein